MRFTCSLFAAAKQPVAPFKRTGKNFDSLFVAPQRKKKAWDGQDKDAFFRDKYAHVHAKQLKIRAEEQRLKKQKQQQKPQSSKDDARSQPQPRPHADFARRFADSVARNPRYEYIYGTNAVRAVLESRKCEKLFTGHRYVADVDPSLLALCRDNEISIETNVPAQHLQIMADQGVHNKYIVKTERKQLPEAETLHFLNDEAIIRVNKDSEPLEVKRNERRFQYPLGIFIDQVTDTHNMGAILRSAQFFGADFVVISSRNSAPISPAVVKASSGAAEFIPILKTAHPLRFFDNLRDEGWSIVATAPNQQTLSKHNIDLTDVEAVRLATDLQAPTLLVVGCEGDGIRTSLLQRSTHQTTLATKQHNIDSLNVSVAAAVLLHSFAE